MKILMTTGLEPRSRQPCQPPSHNLGRTQPNLSWQSRSQKILLSKSGTVHPYNRQLTCFDGFEMSTRCPSTSAHQSWLVLFHCSFFRISYKTQQPSLVDKKAFLPLLVKAEQRPTAALWAANSIVRRKRISRGKKEVGNFSLGTSPDTVDTVKPRSLLLHPRSQDHLISMDKICWMKFLRWKDTKLDQLEHEEILFRNE